MAPRDHCGEGAVVVRRAIETVSRRVGRWMGVVGLEGWWIP